MFGFKGADEYGWPPTGGNKPRPCVQKGGGEGGFFKISLFMIKV